MSTQLENELAKTNAIKLNDTCYKIEQNKSIRIDVSKCYLVELKDTMYKADTIIAINWNRGIVPKCRYYIVDVLNKVSSMIKVNGVGYNTDPSKIEDNFQGWFPLTEIKIISEM